MAPSSAPVDSKRVTHGFPSQIQACPELSELSETDIWTSYRQWFRGWPGHRIEAYLDFHNRHITLGEIGCALSHLGVMDEALAGGQDLHMVLEDDARLSPRGLLLLCRELALLERAGYHWDLIYLLSAHYGLRGSEETVPVEGSVLRLSGHRKLTTAYLVSRRGMEKIAESGFRQEIFAIDDFLPALYCDHPRPDVRRLPSVEAVRARSFVALAFPDSVPLGTIARTGSDTNHSRCVLGDGGPEVVSGVEVSASGAWVGAEADEHHVHDARLSEALQHFFQSEPTVGAQPGATGTAGRVVDLGCGRGQYVRELREAGVAADGIDGNPATPELSKGVCECFDLVDHAQTLVMLRERQYAWAMSLEVFEHVPKEHEAALMESLVAAAARGCIISWATPGQGGLGHVNEQPPDYVLGLFAEAGYSPDWDATKELRARASLDWFRRNVMVFRKEASELSGVGLAS